MCVCVCMCKDGKCFRRVCLGLWKCSGIPLVSYLFLKSVLVWSLPVDSCGFQGLEALDCLLGNSSSCSILDDLASAKGLQKPCGKCVF